MKYATIIVALLFALPVHAASVELRAPFTSEIPDGKWVYPWNNACEEASMTIVDQYYRGVKTLTKSRAKELMLAIFPIEDTLFGTNADTSAARTAQVINEYLGFSATIKESPTIADIVAELDAGRPVIAHHFAKPLIRENSRLRFRATGSYYHVTVIVGYDQQQRQFILHDVGDHDGASFRYSYAAVMESLHDFDHTTKKANGPARVLFTKPKELVRARGSHRIYLIINGEKRYITSPQVFARRNWSWAWVKQIEPDRLELYPTGTDIRN